MPILKSFMNILVIVLLSGLITGVNAQPSIARVTASQPVIFDANNNPLCCPDLYHVSVNENVFIQSTLTSNFASQSFVYIVKITDSDNVTVFLSWVETKLGKNERANLTQSWIPDREGRYKVEIFVWKSLEIPVVLSPVRTVDVSVVYLLSLPVDLFSISIAPNPVDLPERGSANVTVTVRSIGAPNGIVVRLGYEASCKCLEAEFNPTTVILSPSVDAHSILTVRAIHWSPDVQVSMSVIGSIGLSQKVAQSAKLIIVMRE